MNCVCVLSCREWQLNPCSIPTPCFRMLGPKANKTALPAQEGCTVCHKPLPSTTSPRAMGKQPRLEAKLDLAVQVAMSLFLFSPHSIGQPVTENVTPVKQKDAVLRNGLSVYPLCLDALNDTSPPGWLVGGDPFPQPPCLLLAVGRASKCCHPV